ncbi:MAG TPA: DUF3261 domain-containing protein [Steroidobacteraceae bacterium]|nr:DUF3261 domain-containing protein [Steroidobacteraceae bacterium]
MTRPVALFFLLTLSACVSVRTPTQSANQLPLVAPASLNADRSVQQILHGAFGSREVTMNCVVTVRGNTLTVIGLSSLGVRAFTIKYDGQQINAENDLPVPREFTAERLLADTQLVLWPVAVLQPVLQRAGWQLTEPFSGTRRLRRGDKLIAEIHYDSADPWHGRSWLVNLQYGYTLSIDSTNAANTP